MLCQFLARGIPLIILLCRLSISDAVPFSQHPADEVRPTSSSLSKSSDPARKTTLVTERSRSVTAIPKSETNSALRPAITESLDSDFSDGINDSVVQTFKQSPGKNRDDDSETNSSEKSNSSNGSGLKGSVLKSKVRKVTNSENVLLEKCMNEARRRNEISRRSMPLNTSSIDPDKDFKIAGEPEAKIMSSVNVGEDIALCWIETTTIKEDPAFDPPKRLVIREFSISFENSATIPDDYLEYERLEGEVDAGDEETIGKTSLNEVIVEDTKRSRVVNFTSVTRVGSLVVRQHKKIRCSVGGVVLKDIYEWPDGTDNPKKRVEIKVGPSIRDLGARSSEELEDCVTESLPTRPQTDESGSSDCTSSGSCETSTSCEEGQDCDSSSAVSVCDEDDCSPESGSTEEIISTTHGSDSNLLSTGMAAAKELEEDQALKNSSTLLPAKTDRASDEDCDERDSDCVSGKTTAWAETETEEVASGEGKNPEEITENSDESCQEGTEDCSCSGSSCSIHRSDLSISLQAENKRVDISTISPLTKGLNETSAEASVKTIMLPNDPGCDSESVECSTSSKSFSEAVVFTKTNAAPVTNISGNVQPGGNKETLTLINADDEATTQHVEDSELAETIGATTAPEDKNVSHVEGTKEGDGNSLIAGSAKPSIPKQGGSEHSGQMTNNNEGSCEDSDDEDCTSIESVGDKSAPNLDGIATASPMKESTKSTNFTNPKEHEKVTSAHNDDKPMIFNNQTDERIPTIETTAGLLESMKNSSLPAEQSTDCSASSESDDCGTSTTFSSLAESETILPPNQEDATLSLESCDSLGRCGSTEAGLASTEAIEASTNPRANRTTPEGSTCDDSESCESSSSSSEPENCENGSSSDDCTNKTNGPVSESCDSASGSCSSELSDSVSVGDEPKSTTTEAPSKELENSPTTIENVSTTLETRRNTVPTSSLVSLPKTGSHRLALRIKLLLERVNENKEKEKLVQVEKNLLINENPDNHGNQSFLWKVKSLNDTITLETLKAIFNCSTFKEFSEGVNDLPEFAHDKDETASMRGKSVDVPSEKSITGTIGSGKGNSTDKSAKTSPRTRRETANIDKNMVNHKNRTEATKAKAIQESITGIEEDLKKGMDHVSFRISKELDSQGSSGVGKAAESSSSNILKILASPTDGRIHSRRRRGVKNADAVMFVEQLKNPVKGEEIDRWSNERIVRADDGGNVRSVTEFKLMRDAVETSTKGPLGS